MHHDGFDTGGQRLEQRLERGGYGTGSKAAELGYHFHNSGFRFSGYRVQGEGCRVDCMSAGDAGLAWS